MLYKKETFTTKIKLFKLNDLAKGRNLMLILTTNLLFIVYYHKALFKGIANTENC